MVDKSMAEQIPVPWPVGGREADERGDGRDELVDSPDERAPRTLVRIDDGWARGVGIPGFGVVIPNLTGLFGPLGPSDALYWAGYGWFIALAAVIWQGNRALLFAQRAHWDWFQHPVRKLSFLLAANVFYTAPVTVGWLWLWYAAGPMAFDPATVQTVALANTICVVFVTHGYETAFLIRERSDDHLDAERMRAAKAEAELAALRAQIDPHFMFNALNTLAQLVRSHPERAVEFTESLAEAYRYLLTQRDRDLVLLKDELALLDRYAFLLRIRFGDQLIVRIRDPDDRAGRLLIPPVALQFLLENAVKHNRLDGDPMIIDVSVDEDGVRVRNPRRPKLVESSAGVGLANLRERTALTIGRALEVTETAQSFEVWLPALELTA